jgi:N-acetylglucosamine-6-phosphate deacetylase
MTGTELSTHDGLSRLGVRAAVVAGELIDGDVTFHKESGEIVAVGIPSVGDSGSGASNLVAIPQFVDLQVNGFAGIDVLSTDAGGLREMSDALAQTGVGTWLPTCITADPAVVVAALRHISTAARLDPSILGAHLEGPFLSPGKLGAHPSQFRRNPDVELLHRYLAAGPVAMMTIAPELDGADAVVGELLRAHIVVSAGHTMANARDAGAAFDAGFSYVTHLGNAMVPLSARAPGLMAVALTDERATLGLIVDGVHLGDAFVRLAFAAAPNRVALVSDAIAAAGQGDGTFSVGPITVTVADGAARLPNGTLAGSVSTIADGFRRLIAMGIDIATASRATSWNAACLVGCEERARLQAGDAASALIVDQATGTIQRIVTRGVSRVMESRNGTSRRP